MRDRGAHGRGCSPGAAARALVVGGLLVPSAVAAASPGQPTEPAPRTAGATFYVNFDGAVIEPGPDDASTNTSEIAQQYGFSGAYPAYGGSDAQRAAVMAATRADWEDFDVELVDARPGAGPYAMAVIGPVDPPFGPGLSSASPVDCWDDNPSSVGFVFFGAEDLGGAATAAVQAANLSSAFAHALGLEHVTGSGADADIMYPNPSSPTAAFIDDCFVLAMGAKCQDMHAALSGCAQAGEQSSYQELLGLLGPAQTDTQAPSVEITAPADGDELEAPAFLDVVVEAEDDVGVLEIEILLDGATQAVLVEPPFETTIAEVPEGEYELVAVARDAAGNETHSAAIGITVVTAQDQVDPGGGCRCTATASPGPSLGWVALGLLGLLGARRRIALVKND